MPDNLKYLQQAISAEVDRVVDAKLNSVIREELGVIVRAVVREVLAETPHQCRFDLTEQQAKDAGNYVNVVSMMGDGSFYAGLEVVKKNHEWLGDMRRKSQSFESLLFSAVVTGGIGIIGVCLWEGLKIKMSK